MTEVRSHNILLRPAWLALLLVLGAGFSTVGLLGFVHYRQNAYIADIRQRGFSVGVWEPSPRSPWRLTRLETIEGENVSESDLLRLGSEPLLWNVELSRTDLTPAGLQQLLRIRKLEILTLLQATLPETPVDWTESRQLHWLELAETPLTVAQLSDLTANRSVTILGLRQTGLTDAHVPLLANMRQLRRLDLRENAITDAGLGQLAAITTLEYLDVRDTAVTEAAQTQLQAQLPECDLIVTTSETDTVD